MIGPLPKSHKTKPTPKSKGNRKTRIIAAKIFVISIKNRDIYLDSVILPNFITSFGD
jgi:hypothetical protein